VILVGHAFGNFVARMVATDDPDLVRGVVLAAASPGKLPPGVKGPVITPEVRKAIEESGDLRLPDSKRRQALQTAFFARGNNPDVWLKGWHPEAMRAEQAAEKATDVDAWFAGGHAPMLLLQPGRRRGGAGQPRFSFAGYARAASIGDDNPSCGTCSRA
jgi:pimeloyl-ACP methyl ester carboxylesterase